MWDRALYKKVLLKISPCTVQSSVIWEITNNNDDDRNHKHKEGEKKQGKKKLSHRFESLPGLA